MAHLDFRFSVEGLEVSFMVTSKVPAKAIFSWDFGDNKDAYNERQPTHTYEKPGFYTVTLTIESPDGKSKSCQRLLILTEFVKTHLTDSIYNLINEYIPHELSEEMTNDQKDLFINKWQLYIGPLVNRPRGKEIPIEHYNDELYYEGLENQLIMELAAWDYLNVKIINLLTGTGHYISELTKTSESESESGDEGARGDRVKRIQTGPTEVEYYDSLSESASSLFKAYSQALKPGGMIDELRKNLCMLAARLSIYLPFCELPNHPVVPHVVNRRDPGSLGGPNPVAPLNRTGTVNIIPKK